jgi:aspartyl/glutamyl-tRNA(Asn/Gln) amidotransferase C subunit
MDSRETIKYLCSLSKLEITEEELVKYELQIEGIIKYLDKLDSITLSDIEPISQERNSYQLREDNAKSSRTDLLEYTINKEGRFIKGARIT